MTIHNILTGIDDIKDGLEALTSRLKSVEKRVERVEILLQQRNDSAVSLPTPSMQGLAQDASGSKDRLRTQASTNLIPEAISQVSQYHLAVEEHGHTTQYGGSSHDSHAGGYQPHRNQSIFPAELPGEPDFVELDEGQTALASNTVNYPALPHGPLPPPAAAENSRRLNLHPSLRGGWGDEQAEEILLAKLSSTYCLADLRHYFKPFEEQLTVLTKQLSLVVQASAASPRQEPVEPAINARHREASQAQKFPGDESAPPQSFSTSRFVKTDSENSSETPRNTRPVFGLPSTPSRRIVSSFDVRSSPFAIYSHESSPFLRLARKSDSADGSFCPLASRNILTSARSD